jgi:hypothetical protein
MSAETPLTLDIGEVALEARLAAGTRPHLWVIAHPLPRYGGTLDNNVVITARDALQARGYATLRFNFRGVGASTGAEANDERDAADLRRVLAELASRPEAAAGLSLAGYSFGAWVALHALAPGDPGAFEAPGASGDPALATAQALMLFSPPVDFLPFADLRLPDLPCLVTAGDQDSFCAPGSLRAWWDAQPPAPAGGRRQLRMLPGGDHFYFGQQAALQAAIADFLDEG